MTLPHGFRLVRDPATRTYDGGRLVVGGSPRRVLKLTEAGAVVTARLLAGVAVEDARDAALARRLLDTGVAHPCPPPRPTTFDVVVPVFDDAAALDRCLASLSLDGVTVVDDASPDPAQVRDVTARHGADVVRLAHNRGPAAARNAGAAKCTADVIAFVDSDAVVDAETLRRLSAHFSDPAVVAVAPRVRALSPERRDVLAALAESWSPLDLGRRSGAVTPASRVAYVPSTVLLVRRTALQDVGGFDESLRYGEDVDLVWRLTAAGGQVRYVAEEQVRHAEPATWSSWLRRRFRYGTSAAALASRHGDRAAPLHVQQAPAAALVLALAGRPAIATAVVTGTAARLRRRLRAADVPSSEATTAALLAPGQVALGTARWATQLWWPALLVGAARGSARTRATAATALVAPPIVEWRKRRPRVDPLRWTVAVLADEAAYGAGVWRGCLRERTLRPLLPALRRGAVSTSRHVGDTRR